MTYQCPDCQRSFKKLGGWKRHMTATHEGYTADQLRDATSTNEGAAVTGHVDFVSAAASMPESETAYSAPEVETVETEEEQESIRASKVVKKKMRARMDTLKKKLANDMPEQAFRRAGIVLDQDDKQWLGESIETSLEVFGIEFEVEQKNVTVRNPLWVLLYPLLVVTLIVFNKFFNEPAEESTDEQQQQELIQ